MRAQGGTEVPPALESIDTQRRLETALVFLKPRVVPVAGTRQLDGKLHRNDRRPSAQYQHTVRQVDRLTNVVRDEKDGLLAVSSRCVSMPPAC